MGNNETTLLLSDSLLGGFTKPNESLISETKGISEPLFNRENVHRVDLTESVTETQDGSKRPNGSERQLQS